MFSVERIVRLLVTLVCLEQIKMWECHSRLHHETQLQIARPTFRNMYVWSVGSLIKSLNSSKLVLELMRARVCILTKSSENVPKLVCNVCKRLTSSVSLYNNCLSCQRNIPLIPRCHGPCVKKNGGGEKSADPLHSKLKVVHKQRPSESMGGPVHIHKPLSELASSRKCHYLIGGY